MNGSLRTMLKVLSGRLLVHSERRGCHDTGWPAVGPVTQEQQGQGAWTGSDACALATL
jgi:hypothetical protein